jgi:hypothetical protein
MENKIIVDLQNKIIDALKVASQQLIENKIKNNQKIAVFKDGKNQIIDPSLIDD